jgi:hypothetical protein
MLRAELPEELYTGKYNTTNPFGNKPNATELLAIWQEFWVSIVKTAKGMEGFNDPQLKTLHLGRV